MVLTIEEILNVGKGPLHDSALEECTPDWHARGEDCPHGSVAWPLHTTAFTVPNDPGPVEFVAMTYSLMPFILFVVLALYALAKRGSTGCLALAYWFYVKAMAEQAEGMGVALDLGDFKRPPLSCKWSCGMPSGHSVEATAFLVYVALEISLNRSLHIWPDKLVRLAVAGLIGLPIYWSRSHLHDHTPMQLLWGVPFGMAMAIIWYLFLNIPGVAWARHMIFTSRPWTAIGGMDDYEANHCPTSAWPEAQVLVPKGLGQQQQDHGAIA